MAQKNEKDKSERINVGRRAFLKTAGVAPLAAGVVGRCRRTRSADRSRVVGPGEVPIKLMVNGKRVEPERRAARDAAQRDPQQEPISPATSAGAIAASAAPAR